MTRTRPVTASARVLAAPDPAVVADARRWIADCTDTIDLEDLDLTDDEVLACIDREYVGSWSTRTGWAAFIADRDRCNNA